MGSFWNVPRREWRLGWLGWRTPVRHLVEEVEQHVSGFSSYVGRPVSSRSWIINNPTPASSKLNVPRLQWAAENYHLCSLTWPGRTDWDKIASVALVIMKWKESVQLSPSLSFMNEINWSSWTAALLGCSAGLIECRPAHLDSSVWVGRFHFYLLICILCCYFAGFYRVFAPTFIGKNNEK